MSANSDSGYLPEPKGFATAAIHAFQDPEQWDSMAVATPLVTTTTFKQTDPTKFQKFEYGRNGNPNRDLLENCLATLDNGKYGVCWSSGTAAITAIARLVKVGEHIICGDDVYGGTNELFRKICTEFGLETTFASEDKIESAIKKNTKLIFVETLSNPTLKVFNIPAIAAIARKHKLLLAVDNTFLTPYFVRPLNLGADIVMHSITKYINGHTDVMMGITITNNEGIYEKLRFQQIGMGAIPSPFDCYQVTRSLKTLALRMKQHMKNSLEIAKFLESHPKVEKVLHPGLPSHPNHDVFKKLSSGWGGMLSFYLKSAGKEKTGKFMTSLKVIVYAASLGGFETAVQAPTTMSHMGLPEEQLKSLNITDNMVRMTVGLEDAEDLISDLKQALEKL